jgi:hypothetical protein
MFEHLRYHSAWVQTRSPAGELAERVLMLNDEGSVEYREFVLGVIAALEEKKRRLQESIGRIDRRLSASPEPAEQLMEEKASAERDLARIDHHLSRAAGEVPL